MPEESAERCACLRGLHVLFVVDDLESCEPLRAALEQAGALVSVARSAGAAVTALETIRPDVLIADVGDAHEQPARLITRVRALARCAKIPAIVVSGDGGRDTRERLLAAGYREHMRRPVDAQQLRQLVASLAERRE